MSSVKRFQGWLAIATAVICVFVAVGVQKSSAQVAREQAIRSLTSAVPATVDKQAPDATGGSMIMDGDWFYVVRGKRFYKIQKSTMTVFQTLDLN